MKGKDLLSVADLSGDNIRKLISRAIHLKAEGWLTLLNRQTLVLIFEKPSLRTRVSFELAMRQLGGESLYLSPAEVGLGKRESVADVARVLSRYADCITARTFSHRTVEELAKHAHVPVINALSDLEHPCQALADMLTIYEKKGTFKGLTLGYVGDGNNNVTHSLLLAASILGIDIQIASPTGRKVQDRILRQAQDYAIKSGTRITLLNEPREAVKEADVVYTDVWISMGQEAEAEVKRKAFAGYQVNTKLLALAQKDAILMHPLPAHYGEEVAEGMLDDPQSVVFDQAENRLHIQKALLAEILGGE